VFRRIWWNPFNAMSSDEGFRVRKGRPRKLWYKEGKRTLRLDMEPGPFSCWVLYRTRPLRWEPPYDKEQITYEKSEEIDLRLDAAFNFLKWNISVVR
jgi:hypothetical protein